MRREIIEVNRDSVFQSHPFEVFGWSHVARNWHPEPRPIRRIRLTRHFRLFAGLAALAFISFPLVQASAQQQVPPAPAEPQSAPAQAPAAPAPAAPPAFPNPDPANFNASSPTREAVEGFLKDSWGYDDSRVWQVEAILKTPVEGISKVIVY